MAKKTKKTKQSYLLGRPLKFHEKLVLNQWILRLFEVENFNKLTEWLKDPELEGFDENNVSRYCHILQSRLFDRIELPSQVLLGYDQNIVRYWKRITEKRNLLGYILYPKYFQYLSLLFAEIYLDRYFRDLDGLLSSLNACVESFNADNQDQDSIDLYKKEDLNKIAFWMATGSGKTLLMHINILQYQHYLALHNRGRDINRIILLTPNEGLSYQHLEEFELSGIQAELFSKEGRGLFSGKSIEIIDIHKLRDESGEKTVAIDAFEDNNLVLVDEGHRGASGKETGQWMQKRNQLCSKGFSFEYSATFGQAMRASGNKPLEQEYVRCILFDYSYKFFYADGYGKEYRILNLSDDTDESIRKRYLVACLLAFYQQQRLYKDKAAEFRRFLIEEPLWIFVGGSVNAVRTLHGKKVSDVIDILLFLASFTRNENRLECIALIDSFLKGRSGLLDAKGNELFSGTFSYLTRQGLNGEMVYNDILRLLFNAHSSGALHVENLKGTDGEIALRLGDSEPFGLINVGDASQLCKLCDEHEELVVVEKDFSDSLFRKLSDKESQISILIGSKKFTEGWNSWRVSTMGLMNIGKQEGSQIIQLFGRGVRLKGYDFCLKRSRRLNGIPVPKDIDDLEKLNVFGIRADYMRQFKEYLEEEGLPSNEDRIEFVLPVLKNLGSVKLKTVKLQDGIDFKKQGPRPSIDVPDEHLKKNPVVLDWYPKIQALTSAKGQGLLQTGQKQHGVFTEKHIAFMDIETMFFALQRFKNERSWYNLSLSVENIKNLLLQNEWYSLYIPKEELEFDRFEKVPRWQEIAITLLEKYCDRFYKREKAKWENDHLEYRELTEDDSNFINEYLLLVEKSRDDIIAKLEEIKDLINKKQLQNIEFQGLHAIMFDRHLYQPLLHVKNDLVEVKPVALNDGEKEFVLDLQNFYSGNKEFFDGKELYLLRNQSKGRGIGFFEAGNFYPDFILWLLAGNRQYITFVDPKGLRNIDGITDPKIQFYKTIKELEGSLNDPEVTLNSFIISTTLFFGINWLEEGMTKERFEDCNVLFQVEDKGTYISKMLNYLEA